MSVIDAHYQDGRAYRTHWFRLRGGKITSFRWTADMADHWTNILIDGGAVPVEDPFRKGAPLGGYAHDANT